MKPQTLMSVVYLSVVVCALIYSGLSEQEFEVYGQDIEKVSVTVMGEVEHYCDMSVTDEFFELSHVPIGYYEKADNIVPDPEIHTLETLCQTLENVRLPAYERNSFVCGDAATYLEWYLEGAGFDTSIATGVISSISSDESHAWVIVKLPEGDVIPLEATSLCENLRDSPIVSTYKSEFYSAVHQDYIVMINSEVEGYYNPTNLYKNIYEKPEWSREWWDHETLSLA